MTSEDNINCMTGTLSLPRQTNKNLELLLQHEHILMKIEISSIRILRKFYVLCVSGKWKMDLQR